MRIEFKGTLSQEHVKPAAAVHDMINAGNDPTGCQKHAQNNANPHEDSADKEGSFHLSLPTFRERTDCAASYFTAAAEPLVRACSSTSLPGANEFGNKHLQVGQVDDFIAGQVSWFASAVGRQTKARHEHRIVHKVYVAI